MSIYTDKEQAIRKNWLKATIASYLILPALWLLMVLSWSPFVDLNTESFGEFFGLCGGLFVVFFILCLCAYVKPGRKYLIWSLIKAMV